MHYSWNISESIRTSELGFKYTKFFSVLWTVFFDYEKNQYLYTLHHESWSFFLFGYY